MSAKEYLRQTKRIDAIIQTKIEQMEYLRNMLTNVSPFLDPNKVSGGGGDSKDRIGNLICKILEYENEITEQIDRLIDLKREIAAKIDLMKDDEHRLILSSRYLSFKSWEQIAVDMSYTLRHVCRLHGEALQEFEKMSINVHKCP